MDKMDPFKFAAAVASLLMTTDPSSRAMLLGGIAIAVLTDAPEATRIEFLDIMAGRMNVGFYRVEGDKPADTGKSTEKPERDYFWIGGMGAPRSIN